MKKFVKRLLVMLTAAVLVTAGTVPAKAAERGLATKEDTNADKPSINGVCGILMDAKTGKILYAKNIDKKSYPASITKILTTLVAIENNDDLYSTVKFSRHAVNSIEPGSTHIGIKAGEEIPLMDVLYGIMLESANEACNGVAEHTSGSIEKFADLMNKKAKEIGCKGSHFMNPNGLHNDKHYVTARDMALITKAALQNPMFRKIACSSHYFMSGTNKEKKGRELWNHHKMVKQTMFLYKGVEGGKTEYTTRAGGTLVTFAKRGDTELISVILRGNGYELYRDTIKLFDYGFKNYKSVAPFAGLNCDLSENQENPVTQMACKLSPYQLPLGGSLSDFSVLLTKDQDSAELKVYTENNKIYASYGDEDLGSTKISY